MAFTNQVRDWWHLYRCCPGIPVPDGFFGRTVVRSANEDSVQATKALEQGHLGSGYEPTPGAPTGSKRWCPKGIDGRPCQEDGDDCSLHNYCIAIDVEYSENRYLRTRITEEDFDEPWFPSVCKYTLAQVRAIEGIKNTDGEQLWLWLGWAIGDFMHWQINVPPERMTIDWNTVPDGSVDIPEGETMEPDEMFATSWQWGLDNGMLTVHSNPQLETPKQELIEILYRYNEAFLCGIADAEALHRGDTVNLS